MATRRPTDGRLCQNCGSVYFGADACPWCYRAQRVASAASPQTRLRLDGLTRRLRMLVERDGWDCWLCGQAIDPFALGEQRASADRVRPGAQGGTYEPHNIRLAHQSCNAYRSGARVVPFAPFDSSVIADAVRVLAHRARFGREGMLTP